MYKPMKPQMAMSLPISLTKIGKNQTQPKIELTPELAARGWEEQEHNCFALINHKKANHNGPRDACKAAVVVKKPSGLFCGYNPFSKQRRYYNRLNDAANYAENGQD